MYAKRIERVRQKSGEHLADSLLAASLLFAKDWDETSRETAKCSPISGMPGKDLVDSVETNAISCPIT
jgi:hypothetical protein